ncbi:MAG: class I SAM-dependent methyltransferase [Gammaproteobacteria bacterium]|nr:class I SAM-dependent methyltransferase [Gammaproteobacteria bacterium]MBL4727796.1 class I SAM-dependent methyltransferase [Gammaproteobacteria bacterium]
MKSVLSLLAVFSLVCSSAQALDMAALERAMANPDRPAADKERDASRQAPAVLDALGLEAGMTVLDVNASGGWYTEVLSYAVGSNGKVLMQNRPGGRSAEAATARADRLSNVDEWLTPISDIPANTVDFAITALNFHDFHNSDPAAAQGVLAQVMGALKSGGILAVIDHEGTFGADNEALHRIAFEDAVKAVLEAGFVLAGASDVLDNDADDHSVGPFDPSLERNTDRIVLKFMKL